MVLGQHFDPFKRGRALACTGHSAAVSTTSYSHQVSRETHLRSLQVQWPALQLCFAANHEISSTSIASAISLPVHTVHTVAHHVQTVHTMYALCTPAKGLLSHQKFVLVFFW